MAEDKKAGKGTKKPDKNGKKKKSKKNPFKSIASFFKSVNSERKKVVWPTAKETIKNAAIVLLVSVIVGVAIYAVDSVLSLGLKGLKSLAPETTISTEVDEDTSDSDVVLDEDTSDDTTEAAEDDTTEAVTGDTAE